MIQLLCAKPSQSRPREVKKSARWHESKMVTLISDVCQVCHHVTYQQYRSSSCVLKYSMIANANQAFVLTVQTNYGGFLPTGACWPLIACVPFTVRKHAAAHVYV